MDIKNRIGEFEAAIKNIYKWTGSKKCARECVRVLPSLKEITNNNNNNNNSANNSANNGNNYITDIEKNEIIVRKVQLWNSMSDSQMRLIGGEMTAQEIRTVKAILSAILNV